MTKIVKGGITVYSLGDKKTDRGFAYVQSIEFPSLNEKATTKVNDEGVMHLKNPPVQTNYASRNIIYYEDGNASNTRRLCITATLGPSKYKVKII